MKAMQEAYPGPPTITMRRVVGNGDVWVVEGRSDYGGRIYHVANILEFREGKSMRETRYYADPFEAPAWRAQWVEPIESEEELYVNALTDLQHCTWADATPQTRCTPARSLAHRCPLGLDGGRAFAGRELCVQHSSLLRGVADCLSCFYSRRRPVCDLAARARQHAYAGSPAYFAGCLCGLYRLDRCGGVAALLGGWNFDLLAEI